MANPSAAARVSINVSVIAAPAHLTLLDTDEYTCMQDCRATAAPKEPSCQPQAIKTAQGQAGIRGRRLGHERARFLTTQTDVAFLSGAAKAWVIGLHAASS